MPISQEQSAAAIAALHIEALRQGQSLWFRVSSGSMHPSLKIGEEVRIVPASARELRVGDIMAFESSEGLVIHRLAAIAQDGSQLIEMSDVHFKIRQVNESAVVGRVVAARLGEHSLDLTRPLAKKGGAVIAWARYRFYHRYANTTNRTVQFFTRKSARLVVRLVNWLLRATCST